jgi:hypothetical protein
VAKNIQSILENETKEQQASVRVLRKISSFIHDDILLVHSSINDRLMEVKKSKNNMAEL